MKVNCTSCGAQVLAKDIELSARIAKCHVCNEVFPLPDQVASPTLPRAPTTEARHRKPASLDVHGALVEPSTASDEYREAPKSSGRLVIVRRWFSTYLIFLIPFCIAWDSFLVTWYSMALGRSGHVPLMMLLFPLVHVTVGVALTGHTLMGLVNRTTITLDNEFLTVRHGPIPWGRSHKIRRDTIRRLYVELASSDQRITLPGKAYWLFAEVPSEADIQLVKMTMDELQYIQWRLSLALQLGAPIG